MTESNPHERELVVTLRATLDKAAARHDPLLDAALAATRAQIAAQSVPKKQHRWWLAGGFAVAACLALVLVLPFGRSPSAPLRPPADSVAVNNAAGMPDADLQLLEDMDMLTVMSEAPHEG